MNEQAYIEEVLSVEGPLSNLNIRKVLAEARLVLHILEHVLG